jgi:SulP family sulfate permease
VTFIATLTLELEFAILLGVMLSLVVYLSRTSRPKVLARVPDPADPRRKFVTDSRFPECPQFKIVRIDGSLYFGAVNHIAESLRRFREQNPNQKHVLVVAVGINFLDVAGAELLVQEAKHYRKLGGGMYFYQIKEGVCDPLRRGGYIQEIGDENMFSSKTEAVAEIFQKLDRDICAQCDKRIFKECESIELCKSE